MDYMPKLLPSWHDKPLQEIIRQKCYKHFAPLNPPDYGGIGLDVTINSDVSCRIPKYFQSQLTFASDKCALPFIRLKKVIKYNDPCLESLEKEKFDFDTFCKKLKYLRIQSLREIRFNRKLKALEKDINAFNSCNDKDKEINIFAPPSVVHLAERIPKRIVVPEFNAAYAGGTLASCKLSDRQTLIHPKCGRLNKLCITPLLDDHEELFIPDLYGQMTLEFKKKPILQVEQALNGFCVRQENSFHLVTMSTLDTYSKKIGKSVLYHIAASPFNPADILSVYEKGKLKLRNMLTGKTVWSVSDDFFDDPFLMNPTWRCGFGSHPFSAMCMNQKKLYKLDYRKGRNKAVELIFKMAENPSFYVGEDLVGFRQWNKNSFQYFLTSDHHLILCDERYPKTPIMTWNHCLKNPPLYLECADLDSDVSVIVIGSQKNPQLASFVCSHQTDIQPVSLSPPLHLSSTSDCVESLKLHCHYIDDKITSRFSHPLTGICIIPCKLKNGFTVLQSTSLGDIFYQNFKESSVATERTYHVSTGCVLTPSEKILPSVKHLVSQQHFKEVSDKDLTEDCTAVGDNGDVDVSDKQIDKSLTHQKKISANCMFCRGYSAADDRELVNSETCPSCHMNKNESEHFSKALTSDSALIGPTSDKAGFLRCDIEYLSKFDDKYSKRILSVWLDSDPPIDSGIPFDEVNELSNTGEIADERENINPICDEGPSTPGTPTDVSGSPERPQDPMPCHVCDVCQKVYLRKWSLRQHREQVHEGKTFTCKVCQKVFLRKSPFYRHVKVHEGSTFTCDICQKVFNRSDYLKLHRQRHFCNICLKVFADKDAMACHRKTHEEYRRNAKHRCPWCSYCTPKKVNFRHHILIHTGEQPIACDICGIKFRRKGNLKEHMTAVHGRKD